MPDPKLTDSCLWPGNDPLMRDYHDNEWGVPVNDDQKQFEFLTLEAFQAGLSWRTVLYKRENFRKAFAGFDPEKVAKFGDKKILELLNNVGIIRNKAKIHAAINNAQKFLEIAGSYGSFSNYFWDFTEGKPIQNNIEKNEFIPATSPLSDRISKDLKKKGFKFTGSTVIYAHMQATGMVNDHLTRCFRHSEVKKYTGMP